MDPQDCQCEDGSVAARSRIRSDGPEPFLPLHSRISYFPLVINSQRICRGTTLESDNMWHNEMLWSYATWDLLCSLTWYYKVFLIVSGKCHFTICNLPYAIKPPVVYRNSHNGRKWHSTYSYYILNADTKCAPHSMHLVVCHHYPSPLVY